MCEYIGIDVGKENLDLCWLRDANKDKIKTKTVKNKLELFDSIALWITKNTKAEPQDILITLEATGVYHEGLVYFLHKLGFQILLSNPGKAKKFAQSLGLIHKTDKSDATMLAKYGFSQLGSIQLWQPEADELRELKSMCRRLSALEKDSRRENNRLEASKISGTSKRVLKSLVDMIAVLEFEINTLRQDIDLHIDRYAELKKNKQLLLSIKGIGPVMARELVYLFAAKHFTSAKQVAAYAGLIPRLNESGSFKGRTTLSKSGPSRIRAKLFLAAVSASSFNPDIKAQYDRLRTAGKTKMQALGAAMRKLIQICFGVIKHQTEYQPQVT